MSELWQVETEEPERDLCWVWFFKAYSCLNEEEECLRGWVAVKSNPGSYDGG